VRPLGSLSLRAEVVRRVLPVVCFAQMVKAIRLQRVRAASPSSPEESVLLPVAHGPVCLLDQAKPSSLLRPEPLDLRQPLVAGSLLYELQRQLAEEHSWDSPS
jgi:hypothetical protein